ncbi:MAG: hypothetical protein EXR05_00595 [Acetobacteraceae bacterium]|nr:hypothetical protein [Acetobacteraceae bacterium]MSP29463.1 hypothetical protein [Acetobacteraceae bacterium]
MPYDPALTILDHDLAADEFAFIAAIRADFATARVENLTADPKETLRKILARPQHWLTATLPDLSGPGPWRLGRNRYDRGVAAVFLARVELHTHAKSRTDQFPIYVTGAAQGFSLDESSTPLLTEVTPTSHFHNPPGAPHAFLPKVGKPTSANWGIAFLAITPRNLQEDTQAVTNDVRAAYQHTTGTEAPRGV